MSRKSNKESYPLYNSDKKRTISEMIEEIQEFKRRRDNGLLEIEDLSNEITLYNNDTRKHGYTTSFTLQHFWQLAYCYYRTTKLKSGGTYVMVYWIRKGEDFNSYRNELIEYQNVPMSNIMQYVINWKVVEHCEQKVSSKKILLDNNKLRYYCEEPNNIKLMNRFIEWWKEVYDEYYWNIDRLMALDVLENKVFESIELN